MKIIKLQHENIRICFQDLFYRFEYLVVMISLTFYEKVQEPAAEHTPVFVYLYGGGNEKVRPWHKTQHRLIFGRQQFCKTIFNNQNDRVSESATKLQFNCPYFVRLYPQFYQKLLSSFDRTIFFTNFKKCLSGPSLGLNRKSEVSQQIGARRFEELTMKPSFRIRVRIVFPI